MDFPADEGSPPVPGCEPSSGEQRYPDGVEVCSTPEAYYHAMRRSNGELCVRLLGPGDGAVLRCEHGVWTCYLPGRTGRAPTARTLSRAEVRTRLRRCRPVLVADREVSELLDAAGRPAGPTGRPPKAVRRAGGPR